MRQRVVTAILLVMGALTVAALGFAQLPLGSRLLAMAAVVFVYAALIYLIRARLKFHENVLTAVADGIAGLHDSDFSLSIAEPRDDALLRRLVEAYNSLLRAITTRISLERLHQIAVATEPIGYLKLRLLTSKHWLDRALGQTLRGLTIGISYHPDRELRICDTFDWFSPPYQWHHTDAEVEAWLNSYGLVEITNLSHQQQHYQYNYGNGVNFKARRPNMG